MSEGCRFCRASLEPGQGFCSRCGVSTRITPVGEDLLRDRLERVFGTDLAIEREIGRGAMGAVFVAFDPALRRRVAVKALLPDVETNEATAERFLREARIAAALQHPHVVSIFGIRSGDGVRAIIMQFVEGRGLDGVLAETPLLDRGTAARILADVAAALQHAHERGVIHRDIKPANVLLGYDGRAMVTDFGIARQFGTTRITEEGLVMGTLPYVSPEASIGEEASAASDQYSLGIMAFELFAGRRPFSGSMQQLLHAHAVEAPPSLAALRPDLPPIAVHAVHRMLEKIPGARWPTLRDAERVFRGLVVDAETTAAQIAQLSRTRTTALSSARPAPARRPGNAAVVVPARDGQPVRAVSAPALQPQGAMRQSGRRAQWAAAIALSAVAIAGAWFFSGNARESQPIAPLSSSVVEQPAAPPPPGAPRSRPADPGRPTQEPLARTDSAGAMATRTIDSMPPPGGAVAALLEEPVKAAARPETATAPPKPPLAAPARPAAGIADARRIGNAFVTQINQRRWRELEALPATGGDSTARAALIGAVRGTSDVSAGFERIPSIPDMTAAGFETEFILELEVTTRGRLERTLITIVLSASHSDSGWHLAGWRAAGVR